MFEKDSDHPAFDATTGRRDDPRCGEPVPALLRGPSARLLMRVAVSALMVCVGAAFIGAFTLFFPPLLTPDIIRVGSFTILSSLLLAPIAYLIGRLLAVREARASYTTLPNRYRELPQLRPRTGTVIRCAGDGYEKRYRHVR